MLLGAHYTNLDMNNELEGLNTSKPGENGFT
jgi:hypothetical protein